MARRITNPTIYYITEKIAKNGTKTIQEAYNNDLFEVVTDGTVFYIEARGITDKAKEAVIKAAKKKFPEMRYLYDLK